MLPIFDPLAIPETLVEDTSLIKYSQSKKAETRLLGGYYHHVDKPRLVGKKLEDIMAKERYGRDLIINTHQNGYFRINVDADGYIAGLTYYGKREIPTDNYLCLFGLHEKYINRLCSRFDEGIIPDFVSYVGLFQNGMGSCLILPIAFSPNPGHCCCTTTTLATFCKRPGRK